MSYAAVTDLGLVRSNNEDAVFATEEPIGPLRNLYIVADGMGGYQGGEYASSFVVHEITARIRKKRLRFGVEELLSQVTQSVNLALYEKAALNPELKDMGTTLVMATLYDGTLYIVNVGDSRLYYHSLGSLHQITRDHSMVDELVAAGKLSPDDPFYRRHKNVITRAMGSEETVEEDHFSLKPEPGSRILLCSDGLSGMVPDEEIASVLGSCPGPQEAVRELMRRSKANGGKDNISIIVIDIDSTLTERGKTC